MELYLCDADHPAAAENIFFFFFKGTIYRVFDYEKIRGWFNPKSGVGLAHPVTLCDRRGP